MEHQTGTPSSDIERVLRLLDSMNALLLQMKQELLAHRSCRTRDFAVTEPLPAGQATEQAAASIIPAPSDERIVEGVFNGFAMVGEDGRQYQVPPNYASKSKLVQGDRLKLVIRSNGQFMYKQTSPVDRERQVGVLERNPEGDQYCVRVGERRYNVLTASVTYYRGREGDEAALLLPRGGNSTWAAVENIIPSAAPVASPLPEAIPFSPPSDPPLDPFNSDINALFSDPRL